MAVINYDEYNASDSDENYWVTDVPYINLLETSGTSTVNIYTSLTCPTCNLFVTPWQNYTYCPYCGQPLYPKPDKKAEMLERLDAILKEVEDIKKELTK